MKIILLGSNGQLGKSIFETLSLSKNNYILRTFSKNNLNINNLHMVKEKFEEFLPDIVINCAAYTNVDQAEINRDLAYETNFLAVENIAKICNILNIIFVHFSTDYVFDGKTNKCYTEENTVNPLNVYGRSKLAGEEAIQKYCKKFIIIRTSWVFSEHGKNFFKTILNLRKTENIIKVVGDQTGCPTYTYDISNAIKVIIEHISIDNFQSGIYHFSSTQKTTWYEFAKYIIERADLLAQKKTTNLIKINTKDFNSLAIRPKHSVLSNTKILNDYKISSQDWRYSVDEAIKRYVKNSD